MNSMKKRIVSLMLTMLLAFLVALTPMAVNAAESGEDSWRAGNKQSEVYGKGHVEMDPADFGLKDYYEATTDKFPSHFDLRDYNLVTSVKNQGTYGTCWAHATCASLESNALMMGLGEYDLSEYQIGYFSNNIPNKQDDMIAGEGFYGNRDWISVGGYFAQAVAMLSKGYGPVSEETVPYSMIYDDLADEYAYGHNVLNFNGAYIARANNTDAIKDLLTKNGAMYISINGDYYSEYYNEDTASAYIPDFNTAGTGINHAVTLVGWDDNYSKDNFAITPPGDGAWILKNSWGEWWGKDGYYYLSYYDAAMSEDQTLCSFTVSPLEAFNNIYQYDGAQGSYTESGVRGVGMYFKIKNTESISAVKIFPQSTYDTFKPVVATVNIYSNSVSAVKPDKKKLLYTQVAYIENPGYQLIELDNPVNVYKGDRIYVEVLFDHTLYYAFDGALDWGTSGKSIASAKKNETWMLFGGSTWYDFADFYAKPYNACIKVVTRNGADNESYHRTPRLLATTFYMANNKEATINLNWRAVKDAEGYRIYRKLNAEKAYELIATVDSNTLKYEDAGLILGRPYNYRVVAFNDTKVSTAITKTLTATIKAPWIKAIKNSGYGRATITISWVKGAAKYMVYRKSGDGTFTLVGTTTKTTFEDRNLIRGVQYNYKVQAMNKKGLKSALSKDKSVVIRR